MSERTLVYVRAGPSGSRSSSDPPHGTGFEGMYAFDDPASGLAFAVEVAPDSRAVAVHLAPPNLVAWEHLQRLSGLCDPGDLVLSDRVLTEDPPVRPYRRARIRGLPGVHGVYGGGPSAPVPLPTLGREADISALEELLGFGIQSTTIRGRGSVGKTTLLRRLWARLSGEGRACHYVDLAGGGVPEVLVALSHIVGLQMDETRGTGLIVAAIGSALLHGEPTVLIIDHVEKDAARVLQELVAASGQQWLFGSTKRLGIPAEVVYELHPIRNPLALAPLVALVDVDEALARDLLARSGGAPLAARLLRIWLGSTSSLVVFERLDGTENPLAAITEGAIRALDPALRVRMVQLAEWPHWIDEDRDDELEALLDMGFLDAEPDACGVVRLRMGGWLRKVVRNQLPPVEGSQRRFLERLASRCEELLAWVAVDHLAWPAVAARIPTVDATLARLDEQLAIPTWELTLLVVLLDLRVRYGLEVGATQQVLPRLEEAMKRAASRFDLAPATVVRLFRSRGEVFLTQRAHERARADLQRAHALAQRMKLEEPLGRITYLLARTAQLAEEWEAADEWLSEAALSGTSPGEVALAQGELLLARGSGGRALERFDQASAVALTLRQRARCTHQRAVLVRRSGNHALALRLYEEAVTLWRAIGDAREECKVAFQLATLLHGTGALEEAATLLAAVEQLARLSGEDARRGLALLQRGLIEVERRNREEATVLLAEALSAARLGGDRAGQGAAKGFSAWVLHLAGQNDEAREGYRAALRDLESASDRRYGVLFQSLLGTLEAASGNTADARILNDMVQLRIPETEASMRGAVEALQCGLQITEARDARAAGDDERANILMANVMETMEALASHPDELYGRMAHRTLSEMLESA